LKTAGWVTVGVGGAALALGIGMGVAAISKHGDLTTQCTNGVCPVTDSSGGNSTLNDYHTFGTVSTVGFIAGPVLLAAGITMVLLSPGKKTEHAASTAPPKAGRREHGWWIRPVIGPGSFGAVGAF
jgi:hypothetical protein